jgi:hypothetical protein
MASRIPSQVRHVDPYASYNSNTVNKLTQMITRGNNGITTKTDLDVIQDSTSPTTVVDVTPGFIFKDDVLIEFTENAEVDFTDLNCYIAPGSGFDEDGWYAIVFEYTYIKSRPAPTATVKILKPSQILSPHIGTSLLFLKAVYVTGGGPHYIDTSVDFWDYYPTYPTIKREYTDLYFGVEVILPGFNPDTDQGRVVYETSTDAFWFGYSNRWGRISAGVEVTLNTDTTGVDVGTLCYTDSNGDAAPAIATDENTGAEVVVLQIGLAVNNTGRATMGGFVQDVPVESAIIVNVGDLLYLSNTEAGTVTSVKTTPARQVVGRAITGGNSAVPISILFFPRDVLSIAISGAIHPSDWNPDGGLYSEEIEISALDIDSTHPTVIVNVWDDADDKKISPADVEIIGNGTALKIYSPSNTVSWNYIISTGGGSVGTTGGGGGGTNDHSLLFNLTYAASGHTGFAPSPHNNAHHSATYIEAAGVTYENLLANLDIGTGATQVSQGNHTHASLVDIPSLAIILFDSAVQITGYTLQVDQDDQLVYISSGGGPSQKFGSTWSQPLHGHPFTSTHTHTSGSHTHTGGSHTLTITEMPSHRHGISPPAANHTAGISDYQGGGRISITSNTQYTGGGASHNHGSTGPGAGTTGNGTASGVTNNNGTPNSWRPLGRNYTRQKRN